MKLLKRSGVYALIVMVLLCIMTIWGCAPEGETISLVSTEAAKEFADVKEFVVAKELKDAKEFEVTEGGNYTTEEEVALYLHIYAKLPDNFITKKEAEKLGWDSKEGNLWEVAPGKSIGGSRYSNYERELPEAEGRSYFECDVNYEGGYRGSERIVYSNDGLVYYTGDHYKTFTLLYNEKEDVG